MLWCMCPGISHLRTKFSHKNHVYSSFSKEHHVVHPFDYVKKGRKVGRFSIFYSTEVRSKWRHKVLCHFPVIFRPSRAFAVFVPRGIFTFFVRRLELIKLAFTRFTKFAVVGLRIAVGRVCALANGVQVFVLLFMECFNYFINVDRNWFPDVTI